MKKRKEKIIDVGKEARRVARQSGIRPAGTRVIPDKRKRPPKHKKSLLEAELQ
jgi:putative aminopeptidase FrvX